MEARIKAYMRSTAQGDGEAIARPEFKSKCYTFPPIPNSIDRSFRPNIYIHLIGSPKTYLFLESLSLTPLQIQNLSPLAPYPPLLLPPVDLGTRRSEEKEREPNLPTFEARSVFGSSSSTSLN